MSTVHLRVLVAVAVSVITLLVVIAVQAKPIWYPETTLYASGGLQSDGFGTAVAIEQDTLVITAGSGTYVFEHSGSTWVERAKLVPDDIDNIQPGNGSFGRSVAISGDTIAVAAPTAETNIDPGHVNKTGAVYIFTREGSTWKQQAKLFSPEAGWRFGYNMALDQNTVVTGDDKGVYVFERDPVTATWSYTTNLVIPPNPERKLTDPATYLGRVAAVSGNTILVGGKTQSASAAGVLFERQPQTGTWAYDQELVFPVPQKILGYGILAGTGSVALNGNTLLLSVMFSSPGFIGSAYIAKRPTANGDWRQTAKIAPRYVHTPLGLIGFLIAGYGFGARSALKGDYAVVAAAVPRTSVVVHNNEGEVFLFHRQPRSEYWSQLAKLSRHSTKREFVPTVSLSDRYVVVGDRTALNPQGELTGAVHIFALPTAP